MKPQITCTIIEATNIRIVLQRSCGMKPQITHTLTSNPVQFS